MKTVVDDSKIPFPKRVGRTFIHKGAICEVYSDDVVLPDGTHKKFDFFKHNGAAAVIPIMDDGRILMVRQYRNAVDQYTWEIPAGGRNGADEPMSECAYRELEEETGYHAERSDIEHLIGIFTTFAFCNERIEIFVARNLVKTSQHLDDDEFIEPYAFTLDELKEMIMSGEIVDSKTIAGLMTYASTLNN